MHAEPLRMPTKTTNVSGNKLVAISRAAISLQASGGKNKIVRIFHSGRMTPRTYCKVVYEVMNQVQLIFGNFICSSNCCDNVVMN